MNRREERVSLEERRVISNWPSSISRSAWTKARTRTMLTHTSSVEVSFRRPENFNLIHIWLVGFKRVGVNVDLIKTLYFNGAKRLQNGDFDLFNAFNTNYLKK